MFEEEQKHRLWLDIFDYKHPAFQLYTNEGFVEEGRLRESIKRDGRYETLIIMSILRMSITPNSRTSSP